MRLAMGAWILLLCGCHSLPLMNQWDGGASPSTMSLWEQYQHCLVAKDPVAPAKMADQFEGVVTGTEPPAWMKPWSTHVARQPLRTTIDPQALGAFCALRAAGILSERGRASEARLFYERLLVRYRQPQWAYYTEQAAEALAALRQADHAGSHSAHIHVSPR